MNIDELSLCHRYGFMLVVAVLLPCEWMTIIPQKELRNNVGEVLRRAGAGEEITITVAGRPVAQLGPTSPRRWVNGPAMRGVWQTPTPRALAADIERFPASLGDPFE
jgi:prevent-host-death family protein